MKNSTKSFSYDSSLISHAVASRLALRWAAKRPNEGSEFFQVKQHLSVLGLLCSPKQGNPAHHKRVSISEKSPLRKLHNHPAKQINPRGHTPREALGLAQFNGMDHSKNPILKLELPGAGRGYRPNKKDIDSPALNENLNWFEVKFDKKDGTRPFTAYPVEKR